MVSLISTIHLLKLFCKRDEYGIIIIHYYISSGVLPNHVKLFKNLNSPNQWPSSSSKPYG